MVFANANWLFSLIQFSLSHSPHRSELIIAVYIRIYAPFASLPYIIYTYLRNCP